MERKLSFIGIVSFFSMALAMEQEARIDNAQDKKNQLHVARKIGEVGIVRTLLGEGVHDLNEKNEEGKSPLMIATEECLEEVVELLLAKKALLQIEDREGNSLLHCAVISGSLNLVQRFVDLGLELNKGNDFGVTPFALACECGFQKILELLAASGADTSKANNYGETPLHRAAGSGRKDAVLFLLGKGAFANVCTTTGETPLHRVAEAGHSELVDILVANKADVNANNKFDLTPLHLAVMYGHTEVIERLLFYGADKKVAEDKSLMRLPRTSKDRKADNMRVLHLSLSDTECVDEDF